MSVADEGRGHATKRVGEVLATDDPAISEWGNPLSQGRTAHSAEGTGGTETSHVPRGTERIPVVAASEPGGAQTVMAYEAAAAAMTGLNAMGGDSSRDLAARAL